jgi:hypothetical protein
MSRRLVFHNAISTAKMPPLRVIRRRSWIVGRGFAWASHKGKITTPEMRTLYSAETGPDKPACFTKMPENPLHRTLSPRAQYATFVWSPTRSIPITPLPPGCRHALGGFKRASVRYAPRP